VSEELRDINGAIETLEGLYDLLIEGSIKDRDVKEVFKELIDCFKEDIIE